MIAYGQRDGVVVHVSDVPSGLACRCRCLNCDDALVARKGQQRVYHFAHRSEAECVGALEGTLHALAKFFLASAEVFWIPSYIWKRSDTLKNGHSLSVEKEIVVAHEARIIHSAIECRAPPDFVPDVMLELGGGERLFIEIVVTHPVDRRKLRKIRHYGVPTLMIKFEPSDGLLEPELLMQKLIGFNAGKQWCFHPDETQHHKQFLDDLRAARQSLYASPPDASSGAFVQPAMKPSSLLGEFMTKYGREPTYEDVIANRFKWN